MSRYKGRTSPKSIERNFPHIVEMLVPEGDFGKWLDAMYEFHARHGVGAIRVAATALAGALLMPKPRPLLPRNSTSKSRGRASARRCDCDKMRDILSQHRRTDEIITLTLATTRRYFGFGNSNDYVVLNGGRVIGRIMLHPQAPEGEPSFWTITAVNHPPSVYNKGYSATGEQAMADFKARWLL